jgi:peptidoglycan/LPS O-acetylase OafA/YrhL
MVDTKRIPSLDGLRAVSILLVLLGHAGMARGFPSWLSVASHHAAFGVQIFFVISGYLITSLLLKEKERTGRISLRHFYRQRAYRILPAAYAYAIVVTVLCRHALPRIDVVFAFTYLTNYLLHPAWILGHLWSLSVEEQFYLLWPFLIVAFFPQRVKIAIAAIAAAPFVRIAVALFLPHELNNTIFPSVQDALATGCLLAMIWPQLEKWSHTIDRWIIPIVLTSIALADGEIPRRVHLLVATFINAGIALGIFHAIRKRYWWLNTGPVVWLGTLSYSLYLWQQPFLDGEWASPLAAFPLNIICAFGAGAACHYAIEKPFLRLRDRGKNCPLTRQNLAITPSKQQANSADHRRHQGPRGEPVPIDQQTREEGSNDLTNGVQRLVQAQDHALL